MFISYSQNREEKILFFLDYFDKTLHFNLNSMNKYVLVDFNDRIYINTSLKTLSGNFTKM